MKIITQLIPLFLVVTLGLLIIIILSVVKQGSNL